MSQLSDGSEGALEETIAKLVNLVRDNDCETSFAELRSQLQYYIRLFGKKYRIPGCDSDEIEQECLFALRYKAIEDFNPERGKFKSFAILCIKRHLFSLIKANNQQKRTVLNTSLSLDEDRSSDGENLSLVCLITEDGLEAGDQIAKSESAHLRENRLLHKLSGLEQEVYKLYMKQMSYEEIVSELRRVFPKKSVKKKTVDNALQRLRAKAQELAEHLDFEDF